MNSMKSKAATVGSIIFLAAVTYGSTEGRWWFPDFLRPLAEIWPWVLLAIIIIAMLLFEEDSMEDDILGD